MFQSHVIEIEGAFVGVAVATGTGFRFRAVHLRVEELDESVWPSLDDLRRVVRHLFVTGRLSPARAAVIDPVGSAAGFLRLVAAAATHGG